MLYFMYRVQLSKMEELIKQAATHLRDEKCLNCSIESVAARIEEYLTSILGDIEFEYQNNPYLKRAINSLESTEDEN